MPDHKTPKSRSKVLEALYEFLEGPEEDVTTIQIERVLKDLKNEGVDKAPLVQMVRERLAAARAEETLVRAREERARISGLGAESPGGWTSSSLRELAAKGLQGLSASKPELAAVYWRKFEGASDADLESILIDLALLDSLGKGDADER